MKCTLGNQGVHPPIGTFRGPLLFLSQMQPSSGSPSDRSAAAASRLAVRSAVQRERCDRVLLDGIHRCPYSDHLVHG
jgi:hypothetical protein